MNETAFLAHLSKEPGDFTAWRVFADWLQERDDRTGRFIQRTLDFHAGNLSALPDGCDADDLADVLDGVRPEVSQLLVDHLASLPPRFQVVEAIAIGRNPPEEMFGYARTIVCGSLLAGRLRPGVRLMSEDGTWSPQGPLQILEVFQRTLETATAAQPPYLIGLGFLGHWPVAAGVVLVERVAPSSRPTSPWRDA